MKSNQSKSSIQSNESDAEDGKDSELQFSLKIPMNIWDKIKSKDAIYRRTDNDYNGEQKITRRTVTRTYKVLKNGVWTYSLSRAIAQQRKHIPCRWCFKRCKIFTSESAENYITIHGYCITCNAELNGYVKKMPDIEARFVEFSMKISKLDSSKHHQHKIQKNVKISGEQAQSMYGSKEVYGQAARIQRSILRHSVDELFKPPIERVPTKNSIRCIQYRNRKLEQLDACPMKALEILKHSYYNDWIQSIGSDPFYVSHVNTDTEFYTMCTKKKNTLSTIFCDAIGGIAKRFGN